MRCAVGSGGSGRHSRGRSSTYDEQAQQGQKQRVAVPKGLCFGRVAYVSVVSSEIDFWCRKSGGDSGGDLRTFEAGGAGVVCVESNVRLFTNDWLGRHVWMPQVTVDDSAVFCSQWDWGASAS
jgi:hypothetical protein